MKIHTENDKYTLYQGSMLDMLDNIRENSIDSIVTDPPYELNFMGKGWDNAGISFQKDTWEKCFTVLKPGGYLLAFGGSRTFHRIAVAIEDAGFEIRDTIMWIYSSGFPKSMNIGLAIDKKNGVQGEKYIDEDFLKRNPHKILNASIYNDGLKDGEEAAVRYKSTNEWQGWGTQLKPSFEPIIVARKPLEGTCVNNVMKYGVGGINIDECRVEAKDQEELQKNCTNIKADTGIEKYVSTGRFPANTILTYDETDFEEVCSGFPNSGSGNGGIPYNYAGKEYNNKDTSMFNGDKPQAPSNYNDSGSAARYFYCAKASRKDRDEGLNDTDSKEDKSRKNIHPCVKPTELMQYLIRLVTPSNGTILDPFNGSGSTGKAAMYENKERNKNYKYIGIELSKEYLDISKARIDYVFNNTQYSMFDKEV